MDPDAIKREERTSGRPGPHSGRAPEVLSELTERTYQEEPFIDIPQNNSMQLLESKDISVDLAYDFGDASCVTPLVGANAAMDIVRCYHETRPGGDI
jgi:hypothetical protein